MEEQRVTFEVAKIAKEKGYKRKGILFGFVSTFYHPKTETILRYGRIGKNNIDDLIYIPSQTSLQKWLREVHNIHIEPSYDELKKCYNCHFIIKEKQNYNLFYNCKTYEESFEKGLLEALILIKNK